MMPACTVGRRKEKGFQEWTSKLTRIINIPISFIGNFKIETQPAFIVGSRNETLLGRRGDQSGKLSGPTLAVLGE